MVGWLRVTTTHVPHHPGATHTTDPHFTPAVLPSPINLPLIHCWKSGPIVRFRAHLQLAHTSTTSNQTPTKTGNSDSHADVARMSGTAVASSGDGGEWITQSVVCQPVTISYSGVYGVGSCAQTEHGGRLFLQYSFASDRTLRPFQISPTDQPCDHGRLVLVSQSASQRQTNPSRCRPPPHTIAISATDLVHTYTRTLAWLAPTLTSRSGQCG